MWPWLPPRAITAMLAFTGAFPDELVNCQCTITKIQFHSGWADHCYFNQYHYLQNGADRTLVTLR